MKPLQQLFGLALEPIWEHQRKTAAIKTYRKDVMQIENETPDMEQFMKKKEKYCSAKIKTLLFDKYLTQIEHKRTGMQPISAFFRWEGVWPGIKLKPSRSIVSYNNFDSYYIIECPNSFRYRLRS